MTLLFTIVRAAHANGTHHKLALDALRDIQGPYAEFWQRLFLKHAEAYMAGAKAPDNEFKDFKNHVLHVRDNLWGGAPAKTEEWYGHLLAALRDGNWADAARCGGILSHYVTDPIMPFHTGQTEAENNIHRAVEWSISKSYDVLAKLGAADPLPDGVHLGEDGDWLKQQVIAGARLSNRSYEALLTHYDIHRGVVDPPGGLDATSRRLVGQLLCYARESFTRILERAFQESAVVPPDVALTAETVLAGLKVPVKWLLKKMEDAGERRLVESMYDELQSTGRVEVHLPEAERVVKALHAEEVLSAASGARAELRVAPQKARNDSTRRPVARGENAGETTAVEILRNALATPPAPAVSVPIIPRAVPEEAVKVPAPSAVPLAKVVRALMPDRGPLAAAAASAAASASVPLRLGAMLKSVTRSQPEGPVSAWPGASPKTEEDTAELASSLAMERPRPVAVEKPVEASLVPSIAPKKEPAAKEATKTQRPEPQTAEASDGARLHLKTADPVVDAPSIGPKTADRLIAVGIHTVADLFAADPGALAEQLGVDHIRARTIAEWQDQARLVCEVPGLRGTHAQLLVGAGFRDLRKIAKADPRELSVQVLKFAQSTEGQRILRSGGAPDLEKIMSWVHEAEKVYTFKAA